MFMVLLYKFLTLEGGAQNGMNGNTGIGMSAQKATPATD